MNFLNVINSKGIHPSRKYIFSNGGTKVECTFVERPEKYIICLSCMMGCPVGCRFCRSGQSYFGLLRKEDIVYMAEYMADAEAKADKPILFSYMGCGEPLINFNAVKQSMWYLRYKYDRARISLSTSGHGIDNLKDSYLDIMSKIQFSLHNPFEGERQKLIPYSSGRGVLRNVMKVLEKYQNKTGQEVELNYVILDGVNDSARHASQLAAWSRKWGFKLKINQYNDVNLGFKQSGLFYDFVDRLKSFGVDPEIYFTDGSDIEASCGQLKSECQ